MIIVQQLFLQKQQLNEHPSQIQINNLIQLPPMFKNTKKQQPTQSKTNLLQLFRKRIQTRSNKNTPVHPSSIKPTIIPSHQPSNHSKLKVTPSKTSVFSLEQPSQISFNWQGYFNSQKQQLVCHIHNNKQAKFIRENTDEYYCQKCAIVFTNEGHRLTQVDNTTKIKKNIESFMNKQIESIRNSYLKLIELLNKEMEREVQKINRHFKNIQVRQTTNKLDLLTFVPATDFEKILQKIKLSIGKTSLKKIVLDVGKIQNESDMYKGRQSNRLSNRRNSNTHKSNIKKPPAEIMINLYIDEEQILREYDKENRNVNMFA